MGFTMDWEWNSMDTSITVGRLLRSVQISKELTDLRETNYRGLYTRQNGLTSILPKGFLRTLWHHQNVHNQSYPSDLTCIQSSVIQAFLQRPLSVTYTYIRLSIRSISLFIVVPPIVSTIGDVILTSLIIHRQPHDRSQGQLFRMAAVHTYLNSDKISFRNLFPPFY